MTVSVVVDRPGAVTFSFFFIFFSFFETGSHIAWAGFCCVPKDDLEVFVFHCPTARHIGVHHKAQFYILLHVDPRAFVCARQVRYQPTELHPDLTPSSCLFVCLFI